MLDNRIIIKGIINGKVPVLRHGDVYVFTDASGAQTNIEIIRRSKAIPECYQAIFDGEERAVPLQLMVDYMPKDMSARNKIIRNLSSNLCTNIPRKQARMIAKIVQKSCKNDLK